MRLALPRVTELLDRLAGRKIAILGDLMLDRYLIGEAERISPEAPVPVVTVRERREGPGGAANVAANVAAFGGEAILIGVVGDDAGGRALREELTRRGIDQSRLLVDAGRPTTVKTRVLARGQQVVRIDEEETGPLEAKLVTRLADLARAAIAQADALVLEDYNKGLLTPASIRAAIEAALARKIPIVVDPKYQHFFDYQGATLFKPNRRELLDALGPGVDLEHPAALTAAVGRLGVQHLLLTLGPEGMVLVDGTGRIERIPSRAREVFDVSGAGDTVTAWCAAALAAGATALESAALANVAAGLEVGKAGIATVTPAEVLGAERACE